MNKLIIILFIITFCSHSFANIDNDQNAKILKLESQIKKLLSISQKTENSIKRISQLKNEIVKLKKNNNLNKNSQFSTEQATTTYKELEKNIKANKDKLEKLNYAIKEGLVDKDMLASSKKKMEQKLKNWISKKDKLEKIISKTKRNSNINGQGIFNFSGTLDLAATYSEGFDNLKTSNIIIDTFELVGEANFSDSLSGNVALLYEDSSDASANFNVDQAQLIYHPLSLYGISFFIGHSTLPFGDFTTGAFSYPLAYNIFMTTTGNLGINYANDHFQALLYSYKGASKKSGDYDEVNDFGARVTSNFNISDINFKLGIDYISNILDTGKILTTLANSSSVNKYISGYAGNISMTYHRTTFLSEFITASKALNEAGILFNSQSAKIATYKFEIIQNMTISGYDFSFFLSNQKTKEAQILSVAKDKWLFGINHSFDKNAIITLEYSKSNDYSSANNGSGGDSHGLTFRLGVGF